MGWYSDWSFRKYHYISPASGSGTNYQKRIIVHFGTGVDNDENVYLNSKCLANFGDIRFTDDSGTTLLDYWIEKNVDSDYAIFWVEISKDLSVYESKIYIYYGKIGVSSIANGNATFIFFEDFEIDLSRWNLSTPNPTLSTNHAYSGAKCVKIPMYSLLSHPQLPYDNIAVHAHFYDEMLPVFEYTVFSIDAGELEVSFIGLINDIAQYEYQLQGIVYNSDVDRTVGWHEFIIRSSLGLKQFIIDGNIMPVTGTGTWNPRIFLITASTTQAVAYWDLIFYTKFVHPEPSHGIWSVEQISPDLPFEAENIEDMLFLSPLDFDEIMYTLFESAHDVEDPLLTLLLSLYHTPPFASEDILLTLLASRIFEAYLEFGGADPELSYFRIGKRLVITLDGKILFI
jgi:hypothetical protein